jgi:hypothetical protein
MHATGATVTEADGLDWARIERTLRVSIKLMKRGQREIQRLRRRESRQDQPDQAANDAD